MKMSLSFSVGHGAGQQEIDLEIASVVTVFVLAGRYFETRAKRSSSAALRALLDLGAKDAAVLRYGAEVRVPIDRLVVGDLFVVRPGEKVATDGVVEEGASAIDASLLTGESVPVEVAPGDPVTGATVNVGGRLIVRATRVGFRHGPRPDRPTRDRRPERQSACPAPRRSDLGGVRARSDRGRRSARSVSGSAPVRAQRPRSPRPSPC